MAAPADRRLACEMIAPAVVVLGQPIRVRIRFRNLAPQTLHVLRWGNPFAPRYNGLFEVTVDGLPVPFLRHLTIEEPAAAAVMPTARSYKSIPPGESSWATVSLTEGQGRYAIDEPGRYRVSWHGDLAQLQEGPAPMPRPASPLDRVFIECNSVEVYVVPRGP